MVMNQTKIPRLKPLLESLPPGFVVDAAWLKARGIDPKSIHEFVARGWIERIVRGVYRRPLPNGVQNDDLSWQAILISLQRLMSRDVYLGGESALEFAGHVHYLDQGAARPTHFYGVAPTWIKRLPIAKRIVLHQPTLFGVGTTGVEDTNGQDGDNEWSLHVWRWPIKVSCPERAILEAIDELPNHAGFDRLDRIFEGLTGLRPQRMLKLLSACRSVKVRRLFFVFADRHRHGWLEHLEREMVDLGSGPRALVRDGRFHPTYRISVPEFLIPTGQLDATDNA